MQWLMQTLTDIGRPDVAWKRMENDRAVFEVASGNYEFRSQSL